MSEKKEKKKDVLLKKSAAETLANALELPPDSLSSMPRLSMCGNREVFIEGHRGILEYDDTVVRLSAGSFIIRIVGTSLSILSLSPDAVTVAGFVFSVEFIS